MGVRAPGPLALVGGLLVVSSCASAFDSLPRPDFGLDGSEAYTPAGQRAFEGAASPLGQFNTSACANWPLLLPDEGSISAAVRAGAAAIPGYMKKTVVPNKDFSGYSYSVTYKTKTLVAGGGGNVNMTGDSPAGKDSRFFIGSVTKVFTSHLAFILHSKGILNMETKVQELDPNIGAPYHHITLSMLLSHLAGTVRSAPCYDAHCNMTTEYVVQTMNEDVLATLKFPIQLSPMYSNYGFSLAGRLMAKFVGVTYEELITEHIFEPLGMPNSGFYTAESDRSKFGTGYIGPDVPSPLPINGWSSPAGYIYSTAEDMATYVKQFSSFSQQPGFKYLIPEVLTRKWLEPAFVFPGGSFASGHPWEIYRMDGMWMNTKGGAIAGYLTQILVVPNLDLGVVFCVNGNPGVDRVKLVAKLASMVGEPLAEQALALSRKNDSPQLPSDPQNFLGIYKAKGAPVLNVTQEKGTIVAYAGPQRYVVKQKIKEDETGSTWEFWGKDPWSAPCAFPIFWGSDLEPVLFGPKTAGALRTTIRVPGLAAQFTWERSAETVAEE